MVLIFDLNEHVAMLTPHYKNPKVALEIMIGYYLYRDFHLDTGTYDLSDEYRVFYNHYRTMFLLELHEVGTEVVSKSMYKGTVTLKETDLWITLTPTRIDSHVIPTEVRNNKY